MVIITRKKNESIIINDDLIVTVIEIRGERVRLEIDVPNGVPVVRKEKLDAIQRAMCVALIESKVFHRPECGAVKAGADRLVWFKTRKEAVAVKKKPCTRCKP